MFLSDKGRRFSGGFTIVELLIVIVVIAILASISSVAYGGTQDRARNAAVVSNAKKMVSLLQQYVLISGADNVNSLLGYSQAYPYNDTYYYEYCLGEDYRDLDPGPDKACYGYLENPGNYTEYYQSNATLDAALKQRGNYSISESSTVEGSGSYVYGGVTYSWTQKFSAPTFVKPSIDFLIDGQVNKGFVRYYMSGIDQDCMLRPIVSYVNTANGFYNYTVKSTAKNNGTNGGMTRCDVYIPWP